MLLTCKVCAAVAYALNRRLVILPWCEQRGSEALRNSSCLPVSDLFSISQLNKLLPTVALAVPDGGVQARSGIWCGSSGWLGVGALLNASLKDIFTALNSQLSPVACLQPEWKHVWHSKCNGVSEFAMQLSRTLLVDMAAYWLPADRVQKAVEACLQRIGGAYIAVHVRRSQNWLPGELASWSRAWPDVTLPIEHILHLVEFEAARCASCAGRVFVATNTQNDTEIHLLTKAANLSVHFLSPRQDLGVLATPPLLDPIQQVVAELALLGNSHTMLGTPGSTFMENTRHVHMLRGIDPPRTITFCQYRAVIPSLWPECQHFNGSKESFAVSDSEAVRCPAAVYGSWVYTNCFTVRR